MQARLSAERANFFYQLRGLDEETLCTVPVVDGWTARDFLPHLGYWDALYTDRMQRVIDGRRTEIQPLEGEGALDNLNAETRQYFSRLDLHGAMALCLKERNGFLATLARTPDELLYRRIQFAPSWRTSLATWTRLRYKHDEEHATQLGRWRTKARLTGDSKPPASKIVLRPFLQASRQEFMSLATLIPADARNTRPVCGVWTLRDVVGHLTAYEFMGVTALRDLALGSSPQFEKTIRNFDIFNEAQVLAKQAVSWNQILEEYRAVRKALSALLENLSDEQLQRPFVAPWGSAINGYQFVFGLAIHEQEHAADLRNTLNLKPLPQRLRHYRPA